MSDLCGEVAKNLSPPLSCHLVKGHLGMHEGPHPTTPHVTIRWGHPACPKCCDTGWMSVPGGIQMLCLHKNCNG